MRLVEIIRYEREKQTVFVTKNGDYEDHWLIRDGDGPDGWARYFPIYCWRAEGEHRDRMIDGERHLPTEPLSRPWFWTRNRLNAWRAEYLTGWRGARAAKSPALRPKEPRTRYEVCVA